MGDIAKNDYDFAYLQKLAQRDNSNVSSKLPIVKINYDSDNSNGLGSVIIGAEKDNNGVLVNHGKKVIGVVILKIMNQFAYFNDKTKESCYSPIHNDFEVVQGNKFKNDCGKHCPYRNTEDSRCKNQKIVFCIAITESKEQILSTMYVHGESYMPLIEYTKTASVYSGEQGTFPVPYYSFFTKIGTEKRKKNSRDYFVFTFNKGQMFPMQMIKEYETRINEIDSFVVQVNSMGNRSDDFEVKTITIDPHVKYNDSNNSSFNNPWNDDVNQQPQSVQQSQPVQQFQQSQPVQQYQQFQQSQPVQNTGISFDDLSDDDIFS